MNNFIKIFIADDHPVFREGLIKIIESENNLKVVGFAGNGNDALQFIKSNKPDIAILDISMPGCSGIDIAKFIMENELPTNPIILTMYSDEEYLEAALENEVKGYLLKDSTSLEIINCINIILKGGFFISNELTEYLLKNKKSNTKKEELKSLISSLTNTERQILKSLSQNKTSNQIAMDLFISFRTVQNHRINISHKLGLSGHNSLLLFAMEHKSLF